MREQGRLETTTLHNLVAYSLQASGFWGRAEGSAFPRVLHDSLFNKARMTIQFASHNHALISDPTEPKVVFGRASTFKGSEGRIVCSPEVVNFYRAAFMLKGMQYVAALGVGMYTVNFVYHTVQ